MCSTGTHCIYTWYSPQLRGESCYWGLLAVAFMKLLHQPAPPPDSTVESDVPETVDLGSPGKASKLDASLTTGFDLGRVSSFC